MSKSPAQQPNILIIMADDLGFSDIGCFGSEIKTPHLDSLAENGLRLSQFYNGARCCPTRASLLTGLYAHQAGVGEMIENEGVPAYQGYLRDDATTIAELLKAGGYSTFMTGKWHVGGNIDSHKLDQWHKAGDPGYPTPRQRGFDRFYGTLCGCGSYWNPPMLMLDDAFIEVPYGPDFHYTDAINDEASSFIKEAVKQDKPFFGYVAHTAPHWPLHAYERDIAKYRAIYREGWDSLREKRYERLRAMGLLEEGWPLSPRDEDADPWTEAEHKEWEIERMATYAAQVDQMDQGIGRIVDTLKQEEVFENTLVIFLSDNGGCAEFLQEDGEPSEWPGFYAVPNPDGSPMFVGNTPTRNPGGPDSFMSYDLSWANLSNTPLRKFKCWVHEGGISTPLVAHWPQGIAGQGRIDSSATHIIDLMATAMDISGCSYPAERNGVPQQPLEGTSLKGLFAHEDSTPSNEFSARTLFWEHKRCKAVRQGDWKLVAGRDMDWELYNLSDDRTELENLVEVYPERADALGKEWHAWADRVGVFSRPTAQPQ